MFHTKNSASERVGCLVRTRRTDSKQVFVDILHSKYNCVVQSSDQFREGVHVYARRYEVPITGPTATDRYQFTARPIRFARGLVCY